MKKVRYTILVTPDQYQMTKAAAEARGLSMNKLGQEMLRLGWDALMILEANEQSNRSSGTD